MPDFIGIHKRAKIEHALEKVPPLLVAALMVGVMFLPSAAAVPATISIVVLSAVLIACLKKGTAAFDFFTLEKVVYVGLISYSLYLWHWSVLSISRWTIGIHWWTVPIQFGLIFLMAMASYKWVETPWRRKIWFEQKWMTISGGIGLATIAATTCLALSKQPKNNLFVGTNKPDNEGFNRFKTGVITKDECLDFQDLSEAISKCIEQGKHKGPRRTIWLVGDSHAFTLLNGMRKLAAQQHSDLRAIARRATAFPLPPNYLKLLTSNSENDLTSNRLMRKAGQVIPKQTRSGDILILALRFPYHFGPDTYEFEEKVFTYRAMNGAVISGSKRRFFADWLVEVEKLVESLRSKDANLIILGPVPEWEKDAQMRCDGQWFRVSSSDCQSPRSAQDILYKEAISSLNKLSQRHPNLHIVDTLSQICVTDICGYTDRRGRNLYWDDDHLSDYAAINYVAPAIQKAIDASIDH